MQRAVVNLFVVARICLSVCLRKPPISAAQFRNFWYRVKPSLCGQLDSKFEYGFANWQTQNPQNKFCQIDIILLHGIQTRRASNERARSNHTKYRMT